MPEPTLYPLAAAVRAFRDADPCGDGDYLSVDCEDCVALGLRAALPHLIEAVIAGAFPDGQYEHTSAGPIADLRRAAARLTP